MRALASWLTDRRLTTVGTYFLCSRIVYVLGDAGGNAGWHASMRRLSLSRMVEAGSVVGSLDWPTALPTGCVVPDVRQGSGRPAAPAIQARVNWSPLLTPRGTSFAMAVSPQPVCSARCHGAAPPPMLTRLAVPARAGPSSQPAGPWTATGTARRLWPAADQPCIRLFFPFLSALGQLDQLGHSLRL